MSQNDQKVSHMGLYKNFVLQSLLVAGRCSEGHPLPNVIWKLEPDRTKGHAFHMFKIDPLVGGRSIVWKPYITVNQHLIW